MGYVSSQEGKPIKCGFPMALYSIPEPPPKVKLLMTITHIRQGASDAGRSGRLAVGFGPFMESSLLGCPWKSVPSGKLT